MNSCGKTEEVWNTVAPEKVGFLHYSRNRNRDADNVQDMDGAQDTRLENINLRDALKTGLL